ncbi:MAG: biotin carboxylase N-terminal domain-containing protein [Candidatus Limnocylindrales bacterium]
MQRPLDVAAQRMARGAEPSGRLRTIRRVLVANRGEIVVRIARTCRGMGIAVLALVSDDQRESWWIRAADEVVPLPTDYLDGPGIIAAAIAAGADAVHPGYGFLAERPEFAEAVTAAGMTWIGPPASAMRALGDKAAARRLALQVGVPVLPGYDGRGQSDAVLRREVARIGYPVIVKPSAGGGGKGMHVLRTPAELRGTLASARREAKAAFGDDRLIVERYLDRPRHVEVQLLLDGHGAGIHLGERDCSLQRRHQKVVEEAPAPGVGRDLRDRLGKAALRLAKAAGYVGVGTAEFLLADDGAFVFLEMNARLQVEHPVTEAVTGIDLIAAQLRLAGGDRLWLGQADVRVTGHAFEARLYAEDPWHGFLPAVGPVLGVHWPAGAGIRVDAGIAQGDEVGTRYDPLLAKLIATGSDRRSALARISEALAATRILGLTTNRGALAALLALPDVVAGDTRTDTIETGWHPEPELPETVWTAAASALLAVSGAGLDAGFRLNGARRLAIEIEGERRIVPLNERPGPMAVVASGDPAGAQAAGDLPWFARAADPSGGIVLDVDGRAVRARLAAPPTVDAAVRAAHHGDGVAAAIIAPMPGVVGGVRVRAGQTVEAHEVLLILEAMKMENAISAPVAGAVERILVKPGQAVQRGDVLVELGG